MECATWAPPLPGRDYPFPPKPSHPFPASGRLPGARQRPSQPREIDAALADFQSAADLNPTLADAHNGIAMIYVERHDQRHALRN